MEIIQQRLGRPLLYQEVIKELYKIIDTHMIRPGGQFPPERELIEHLGVSRNVLREAFHVLEIRGIITSHQGKGRFLRSVPKRMCAENRYDDMSKNLERFSLLEAYEVRQALEVKAMELIVRNSSDEDIKEIEDTFEKMINKFKETRITVGEFELHRMYARKTGSLFMEQTLEIVLSATLDMMHSTFNDVMSIHKVEEEALEHSRIIEALKARDVENAELEMFEHLQKTINLLQ